MNALAIDPRDANILYAGAAEGGVWKTSNSGASWTPLTDTQLVRKLASGKLRGTLSIGSLAVNPVTPDIVHAGIGDPNVACCFVGSGLGVFRSPDAGNTWSGLNANQTGCQNGAIGQGVVNRMIVIPRERDVECALVGVDHEIDRVTRDGQTDGELGPAISAILFVAEETHVGGGKNDGGTRVLAFARRRKEGGNKRLSREPAGREQLLDRSRLLPQRLKSVP